MSKARIPDALFVDQTLNNGGASRELNTHTPPPSEGYMVGAATTNAGTPYHETAMAVHEFCSQRVKDHAQSMQASFSEKTRPVYQGSWRDGGRVVLDASEHYQDRLDALRIGRERRQKAVYDLGSDAEVKVPYHKAGAHKATPGDSGSVSLSIEPGGEHRYEGRHKAGSHRAEGAANFNPLNNPGSRKYVGKHRA